MNWEHAGVGMVAAGAARNKWQLIIVVIFCLVSHWFLDGGNRVKPDEPGEHDHYVEDDPEPMRKTFMVTNITAAIVFTAFIVYAAIIGMHNWYYMLIAVAAAIGPDWEWVIRAITGKEIGLHEKMWKLTGFMGTPSVRIWSAVMLVLVIVYLLLGA